ILTPKYMRVELNPKIWFFTDPLGAPSGAKPHFLCISRRRTRAPASSAPRLRFAGDPENRGDLAELTPELAPRIAAVIAPIQIAVAAGREDGVGSRRRKTHRPDRRVRRDRQQQVLPRGTGIN